MTSAEIYQKFLDLVGVKSMYLLTSKYDVSLSEEEAEYLQDVVIPHKLAVFNNGLNLLKFVPDELKEDFRKNLITHDSSKFYKIELDGYIGYFKKDKSKYKEKFKIAWHHHKLNNPHHPEHWLSVNRNGEVEALPMPEIYIWEMVADWLGAGETYSTPTNDWLKDNLSLFLFHPKTLEKLKEILAHIGYKTVIVNNRLFIDF